MDLLVEIDDDLATRVSIFSAVWPLEAWPDLNDLPEKREADVPSVRREGSLSAAGDVATLDDCDDDGGKVAFVRRRISAPTLGFADDDSILPERC